MRALYRSCMALCIALTGANLAAEQALPFSPDAESRLYRGGAEARLAPNGDIAARAIESLEELEPNVGIEIVVRARLSDSMRELQASDPDEFLRVIYNTLHDFDSMAGIEYYSASRDRMRIYLHEAHRVASERQRRPLEDPSFRTIPLEQTSYLFHRDSSFGRNVYQVRFRRMSDGVWMRMTNETQVFYSVVPVMSRGDMQTNLFIAQEPGMLIFYGNMGMRVTSLFGLDGRVQDSFTHRLRALYAWFASQLQERLSYVANTKLIS